MERGGPLWSRMVTTFCCQERLVNLRINHHRSLRPDSYASCDTTGDGEGYASENDQNPQSLYLCDPLST